MPVDVQDLEYVQRVAGADMVDDGPVADLLHVKFLTGAGHEDYLSKLEKIGGLMLFDST